MTEELTTARVTEMASREFEPEQRELIRRTIAPTLTEPEFELFLSLCAMYQLNPLHGEIWAAKMPGRNGEPGKFTPMVGRDGFLAIANRRPDFQGMDHDVVREHDVFRKLADGTFEHTYEMGGEDRKLRGNIVGAYCVVHRKGRRPTTFFAPWHEYNSGKNAWRSNPSAMILKCAIANGLRLAYNLSGLYSDAEMDRLVTETDTTMELDPNFGDDELGERLRSLVDDVNRIKPGAYKPAKVRLLLAHATDLEREAFADTLAREIAEAAPEVEVVDEEPTVDPLWPSD